MAEGDLVVESFWGKGMWACPFWGEPQVFLLAPGVPSKKDRPMRAIWKHGAPGSPRSGFLNPII